MFTPMTTCLLLNPKPGWSRDPVWETLILITISVTNHQPVICQTTSIVSSLHDDEMNTSRTNISHAIMMNLSNSTTATLIYSLPSSTSKTLYSLLKLKIIIVIWSFQLLYKLCPITIAYGGSLCTSLRPILLCFPSFIIKIYSFFPQIQRLSLAPKFRG